MCQFLTCQADLIENRGRPCGHHFINLFFHIANTVLLAIGTMEVIPRDSFRVRAGVVDIHFLEPIPSAGLTYEDRNRLSRAAWDRMADAMHELYGVESVAPVTPLRDGAAAD